MACHFKDAMKRRGQYLVAKWLPSLRMQPRRACTRLAAYVRNTLVSERSVGASFAVPPLATGER